MTSPHLPLWRHEYISSVWRFSFNHDHVISILNFPVNDLCHDSIGNKLFGFVFSRSDEPIVIGVCGMRSADQDHRIVSEPIASGSFLESGPGTHGLVWGNRRDMISLYRNFYNVFMMTSSNGSIIRVTGHLCGEFTGSGEFPAQRPVTRSFDIFFDLRLNKRLSKHSWGWWFETLSCPLWRHCNVALGHLNGINASVYFSGTNSFFLLSNILHYYSLIWKFGSGRVQLVVRYLMLIMFVKTVLSW